MHHDFLNTLGLTDVQSGANTGGTWLETSGELLEVTTPIDGSVIGSVRLAGRDEYEQDGVP